MKLKDVCESENQIRENIIAENSIKNFRIESTKENFENIFTLKAKLDFQENLLFFNSIPMTLYIGCRKTYLE